MAQAGTTAPRGIAPAGRRSRSATSATAAGPRAVGPPRCSDHSRPLDAARKAVADAPGKPIVVDASGVDYCDGAGPRSWSTCCARSATAGSRSRISNPGSRHCSSSSTRGCFDHDLIPSRRADAVVEEIGVEAAGLWRDIRAQVEFVRREQRSAGYAADASPQRALEGRMAHLRARRCRCLAHRRAGSPLLLGMILRVPVRGADEALRRRDLRRRPDRARRCCASWAR